MSVGRSQVDSPKVACWAERRRPSLRPLHALRVRGEHATLERDPAAGPPANPSHLERALTDRAALAVDLAGVRVFEHYHPKENPILNPTPARLRLEGTFSLVGGLFIVMVLGALLALMLGAPFPAFLMSDSMRIVKAPDGEEALLAGSFVLVGYFMVFGLLIAIGGLWQIKGHVIPAKARWNTVWLFIAGGILLQLVYLWINGQS